MRVCLDAETDNLAPFYTRIHCVCVKTLDGSWEKTYTNREEFIKDSAQWTEIATFNGCGFDYFALWLLWQIPFTIGPDTFNGRPVKHTDLLVLSRYLHPDRIDAHSLFSWGIRVGLLKIEYDNFTELTDEMIIYCMRDVEITRLSYPLLMKEAGL